MTPCHITALQKLSERYYYFSKVRRSCDLCKLKSSPKLSISLDSSDHRMKMGKMGQGNERIGMIDCLREKEVQGTVWRLEGMRISLKSLVARDQPTRHGH